jgi:hypothetical protein
MFNLLNKDLTIPNCFLYTYNVGFWISIISINLSTSNYINYYSNEWLYLIKDLHYNNPNHTVHYKDLMSAYSDFKNKYNYIITSKNVVNNIIYVDENVVQLFTTFSRGTVHGFSGFYYMIIEYLHNIHKYTDLKILFYKDSQQGIFDIFNYLCEIKLIDKNKIIYIENDKKYIFKSITHIPNKYHGFVGNLIKSSDIFIQKYLLRTNIISITNNENLCLLKTCNTNNSNQNGIFNQDIVNNFCKMYNIFKIEQMNELDLIHTIYNCKLLIITFGSAFFKNFIYISDKCEKIIVVVNGSFYTNAYYQHTQVGPSTPEEEDSAWPLLYKYKNATIKYIVVNNDLNFNPFL